MPRAFVLTPLLLAAVAAPAQPVRAPVLSALEAIERGEWRLRPTMSEGTAQTMCLTDPAVLLQLRHAGQSCQRFVVENQPRVATVTYSCSGVGSGRTRIKVETPRLVQIDSQGIADNAPFAMAFEARRIGDCRSAAR